MSTAYEQAGRTRQKQRTRDAIIAAARDLVALGGTAPTVEEAASAASVSRTTAYRYFRSQQALLVAAHPETDAVSMLPADVGTGAQERLLSAVGEFGRLIIETENQQRTMLRLSLDPETTAGALPLPQGRAIGWFEEALSPLTATLGESGVRRLAVAVRSAVGIESLVWLTDVAGLSRDDAAAQMRWTARAMLTQALADAGADQAS